MTKRRIRVVSAAVSRAGRYLITQRTARAVLPLLWEFPGGRVEEGEADDAALVRELRERLGVEAKVLDHLSSTVREYDEYVVELHLYRCDLGNGEPRTLSVNALRWVHCDEFEHFQFTPADQSSMDALLFGKPPR